MAESQREIIDENISVITARLFELILNMPYKNRKVLLKQLEDEQTTGKRQSPREKYFKDVDFATKDRVFRGFIQNISADGVLIETGETVEIGQDIILAFELPKLEKHIKIKGRVARILPNGGFGVKFDTRIEAFDPDKDK